MRKTKAFKELKKKYGDNGKKGCGRCSSSSSSSCSSSSSSSCSSSSSSSCCRRGPPRPQGPPGDPPNVFGNCSDGDFTDCNNDEGTVTLLVRDVYFHNMTVCNSVNANGYRIFVCGTLTLNGGTIFNNGGPGAAGCPGDGAHAGTLGGGYDGGCEEKEAQTALTPILGGLGGAGVSPGGSGNYPTAPQGDKVIFNNFVDAINGRTLDDVLIYGGTGGGSASTFLNFPGAGYIPINPVIGGGGGGGGVVGVFAKTITGTGTFEAVGGNGYQSATTGGGGGGVIIQIFYDASTADITYNVSGGLAGPGGQNGQAGSVYLVPTKPAI